MNAAGERSADDDVGAHTTQLSKSGSTNASVILPANLSALSRKARLFAGFVTPSGDFRLTSTSSGRRPQACTGLSTGAVSGRGGRRGPFVSPGRVTLGDVTDKHGSEPCCLRSRWWCQAGHHGPNRYGPSGNRQSDPTPSAEDEHLADAHAGTADSMHLRITRMTWSTVTGFFRMQLTSK